jgi:rfaE bifunctional protein kinase chain/domain
MNAETILAKIKSLRVLVVGDICLDRWCWYDPALLEPSAETGIPRIGVVRTVTSPGAGGTVANNLVALGVSDVSVLGVAGEDGFGWELRRALSAGKISPDLMISSPDLCTFTYTKLINVQNDVEDRPRVDWVNTSELPASAEEAILNALSMQWPNYDVLIVSDQAETENGGVITEKVRSRISEMASADLRKIVWVDSRKRPELFEGVVVKPNRSEAEEASLRKFGSVDLARLAAECRMKLLVVTDGDSGAIVYEHGSEKRVPGRQVKAVDICGAGDSFSAGAACALSVTGSATDAARFGNLVASITVTKKGTGTATPAEVLDAAREMASA